MRANEQVMQGLPPDEVRRAKEMVKGIDIGDIDVGELGKKVIIAVIDFVQAQVLPKLVATNAALGYVVAAVLDAIEGALK